MQPSLNAHLKQSFGSTHILSVRSHDTSKGHQKRPDGLTLVPWAVVKQLLWDVTAVDASAPSRISAGVTFDQNGAKMHGNIENLLKHSSGEIGNFDGLTVLVVELDELGRINLKWRINFKIN